MDANVKIEFADSTVLSALGVPLTGAKGHIIQISDDCTATIVRSASYRTGELNFIVELVVSFVAGTGSNVFASWLSDRLKKKRVRLRINHVERQPTKRKIAQAIEKKKQPTP